MDESLSVTVRSKFDKISILHITMEYMSQSAKPSKEMCKNLDKFFTCGAF